MKQVKLTMFALAIVCVAMPISSRALTYDTHSYRNSDGSSKLQDPDDAQSGGGDKSGFSMKFSGGSSNQYQDNTERLFLPQSGRSASPMGGSDNFDSALGTNRRW